MERAPGTSWRFAESVDELPHVALYTRDAAGLDVAAGPASPPPVLGPLPDRSAVLDDGQRRQAAAEWSSWWSAVVDDAARANQGPAGDDGRAWLRDLRGRSHSTGGPPDFVALADRPALRKAVMTLFPEACRWSADSRRAAAPAGEAALGWELTSQVAQDVAFDRGVPLETVRGVALVLAVRGIWWVRYRPGVVLCSVTAAREAGAAPAILRAAFEPG